MTQSTGPTVAGCTASHLRRPRDRPKLIANRSDKDTSLTPRPASHLLPVLLTRDYIRVRYLVQRDLRLRISWFWRALRSDCAGCTLSGRYIHIDRLARWVCARAAPRSHTPEWIETKNRHTQCRRMEPARRPYHRVAHVVKNARVSLNHELEIGAGFRSSAPWTRFTPRASVSRDGQQTHSGANREPM